MHAFRRSPCMRLIRRGESESIRRTPTGSGSGQMTFVKKRTFHFGGASGLLLCAMADGAMAKGASAAATALPEITVTAPSPIVRRKPVVPSRAPARVARAAPGQNRQPAPEPQAAPVAHPPQQGVLPVITDQFATVTVVPNEELRR